MVRLERVKKSKYNTLCIQVQHRQHRTIVFVCGKTSIFNLIFFKRSFFLRVFSVHCLYTLIIYDRFVIVVDGKLKNILANNANCSK